MKTSTFIVLTIFSTLSCTLANAQGGAMGGGGGRAVVCRDKNEKILSAEMLDLYEAREVFNLTLQPDSGDDILEYGKAHRRWAVSRHVDVWVKDDDDKTLGAKIADLFFKDAAFISLPKKLETYPDSYEPVVPENCKTEQLAIFYLDKKILIQKEIWDHLSSLSRAALIHHEWIYEERRHTFDDTDSRFSRKVNGLLFSTAPVKVAGVEYEKLKREHNSEDETYECDNQAEMSSTLGWYSLLFIKEKGSYQDKIVSDQIRGSLYSLAKSDGNIDGNLFTDYFSYRNESKFNEPVRFTNELGESFILQFNNNVDDPYRNEHGDHVRYLNLEHPLKNGQTIKITLACIKW